MRSLTVFTENLVDISLLIEQAKKDRASKDSVSRARSEATCRSALVLFCGYFEGFLRDLLAEYVDLINRAKIKSCSISGHLLTHAIAEILDSPEKLNAAIQIKTGILSNSHLPINSKKLSKTGGNPTVETVENLFAAVGIPEVIEKLSVLDFEIASTFTTDSQITPKFLSSLTEKLNGTPDALVASTHAEIVALIESKLTPKKRRRNVGYVNFIQELLKSRNRIAHGEGKEHVAIEDLEGSVKHISKLCAGLQGLLELELNKMGAIK